MDPEISKCSTLAEQDLLNQITEWNKAKSDFDSNLSIDILPSIQPILLKRLQNFQKLIEEAKKKMAMIRSYVIKVCRIEGLNRETYGTSDMADLESIAHGILKTVGVMLEKAELKQPIPLKKLPYEFHSRLVDLLPPRDLVSFEKAGYMRHQKRDRQGLFFYFSIIVDTEEKYASAKTRFTKPFNDVVSVNRVLKSNDCYVKHGLALNLDFPEEFEDVIKIISGDYIWLEINGNYTWKQAVKLINSNFKLNEVYLYGVIQLDEAEFDEFFEAMAQWLFKKSLFTLEIRCAHLDDTFKPRFKEIIERETQFNVYFPAGFAVVTMEPWLGFCKPFPQNAILADTPYWSPNLWIWLRRLAWMGRLYLEL